MFEKLEKDSDSAEIFYNIWLGSFKSFECNGITLRSNYDLGHYSTIETETLTFKFSGYPELNEYG
jgi:glycyl-tRNA synthetase (class II)